MKDIGKAVASLLRKRPFAAFEVVTNSGTRVEIRHPEACAVGGDLATVFTPKGELLILSQENIAEIRQSARTPSTRAG